MCCCELQIVRRNSLWKRDVKARVCGGGLMLVERSFERGGGGYVLRQDALEPSLAAYMDAARLASDEVDRVERRKQSYIRPVQRLNAGP